MSLEGGLARAGPLCFFVAAGTSQAAENRACGPAVEALGARELKASRIDVRHGPGFALVRGAEGHAEGACAPGHIARALLRELAEDVSQTLDVDPALAVVLTSGPGSCTSIYYAALANDVRGIGYGHTAASEIFDDTPGSALEGVVFLNDWPYWREHPEELMGAFAHEVGHRWGARVHARLADEAPAALLGREDQHWSYLLDTGGSPLEGNAWMSAPAGFESRTPLYSTLFSPLDLYLMGAVGPSDVPPFTLLTNATFEAEDCRGQRIGPTSPPQSCGSVNATAEPIQVSIEDIIAVEGPRVPSASGAVQTLGVLPIVLETGASALAVETCGELSTAVAARLAEFEIASSGHLRLENVLGHGDACETLCGDAGEAAKTREPAGCALGAPRATVGSSAAPFGLCLLALALFRRRGR